MNRNVILVLFLIIAIAMIVINKQIIDITDIENYLHINLYINKMKNIVTRMLK